MSNIGDFDENLSRSSYYLSFIPEVGVNHLFVEGQALQLTSGLEIPRHSSLSAVGGASIEGKGDKCAGRFDWRGASEFVGRHNHDSMSRRFRFIIRAHGGSTDYVAKALFNSIAPYACHSRGSYLVVELVLSLFFICCSTLSAAQTRRRDSRRTAPATSRR